MAGHARRFASIATEAKPMQATSHTTVEPDELLTEAEAARLRRQSIRTLQAERLRGDGCSFVKLGRSVRYRRSDVVQFIESNIKTSTTAVPR
jgi:hypothetical protein